MTNQPSIETGPNHQRGKVLIVDDEPELTSALVEMLSKQGFETKGFTSGSAALETLARQNFDILLADLMMPEMDGITLLRAALEIDPNLISIIMTGQGTVQTAVDAMKSGAFDYIMKPFKLNTVLSVLARSLEVRSLRLENVQLREMLHVYELGNVVSHTLDTGLVLQKTIDAAMQQCQAEEASILLAADDPKNLVIVAATGEGRERLVGKTAHSDGTIAGWVARSQETLIMEGDVIDGRFAPEEPRPEIITSISLPMVTGSKLVGVVNLNRTRRHPPLNQGQVKGLTLLVGIAASALENARLYEQTEKRLSRLMALRTIDLAITSSIDLRVTLQIVIEQVMAQLSIDAAAIRLLNPYTQYLEYAAGQGFRTTALEQVQVLLGEGYGGTAALERRTVQIDDLASAGPDPAKETLLNGEEVQSGFFAPLIAKGEIEGVLEVYSRTPVSASIEWLSFLEALAGQAAIAIDNARLFDSLQLSNQQLMLAYNATIEGWSRALDLRDRETEGHTRRVTEITMQLARSFGIFSEDELIQIRRGALLHDIGKMGVPDSILLKPGELTLEEEEIMRKHPEHAYMLLSPIHYLRSALDIPYSHHEWWDGTGYPRGLKGEQIPIAARIFAVVDVWDALRSDRPYRPGWSEDQVLVYIQDHSGKQFDPQVVEMFIRMAPGKI